MPIADTFASTSRVLASLPECERKIFALLNHHKSIASLNTNKIFNVPTLTIINLI